MIVCHALFFFFFFCKVRNERKMARFGVVFMNFYVNLGKNLRNSKNLQIFKNFLLEVQKRHYVSLGCVTMRLFERKFAL